MPGTHPPLRRFAASRPNESSVAIVTLVKNVTPGPSLRTEHLSVAYSGTLGYSRYARRFHRLRAVSDVTRLTQQTEYQNKKSDDWSFSGRDFVVRDKKGAPFLRFDVGNRADRLETSEATFMQKLPRRKCIRSKATFFN